MEILRDSDVGCREVKSAVDSLVRYIMEITGRIRGSGDAVPSFQEVEAEVAEHVQAVGRAAVGDVLSAYEPTAELVDVEGRVFGRMSSPTPGRYVTLWGRVNVPRYLYREHGVHNGPTVVPLELRAGLVLGSWTPSAAEAAAHLHQALPAREAAETCKRLKVLGVSRSTLLRVGEELGEHWRAQRTEGEKQLVREMELDERARTLSVSVDRVTVRMAERPAGKSDGKKKVDVVFRQAFCAVLTLHDAQGESLSSIRYGQMPSFGRDALEQALQRDISILMTRRPDLRLVGIADGAPEMQGILDRACGDYTPVTVLVDYWHLIEKLAAAVTATGRDQGKHLPDWRRKLLTNDDAIENIDRILRTWMCDYHEDDVPDALYDAFTYLDNNAERMRYATLRANGLPIGSGQVEATCKTLVAVRMKRAGARWKPRGAQACLQLRALACSTASRWNGAMRFIAGTFKRPVTPVRCAA